MTIVSDDRVGEWVSRVAGMLWVPGLGTTLGLINHQNELVAGVIYTDFSGKGGSLSMHVAAVSGQWLTRDFLYLSFHYPFVQLDCRMVFGVIPSTNHKAKRFLERLGFSLKATLEFAQPNGDTLIYGLARDDCRWLKLNVSSELTRPCNVKTGCTRTA